MVRPADMPRVPTLLAQAADRCGARVVQAIQHEASARYFVLAKDDGHQVGFLNPDCCGDYRRRGRLWLRADSILAARTAFKNFYVPSVPDEFIYYLIKKLLKQSIDASQMRRLHGLHQRAPHDCRNRLLRFWSTHTADAIEQALVEQDLFWFVSNSDLLLAELEASRPVEHRLDRFASTAAQNRRLAEALSSTNWDVRDPIGKRHQPSPEYCHSSSRNSGASFSMDDCSAAGGAFRPAPSNDAHRSGLALCLRLLTLFQLAFNIRVARMRSTLAICAIDHSELLPGSRHRLFSLFVRVMFRPDLLLFLTSGHSGISTGEHGQRNSLPPPLGRCAVTYLNERLSLKESVDQAQQSNSPMAVHSAGETPDQGPLTPSEAPFSQVRSEHADLPCMEAD